LLDGAFLWVLGDDVLASVILGRLLRHRNVISINGPSYRAEGPPVHEGR